MMTRFRFFGLAGAFAALALTLGACQQAPVRDEIAMRIAAPSWMVERRIPAGDFALAAFERMHKRHAPASVYIEGDGAGGAQLFKNPAPLNPVALHLASRDKADNLVWLARPCQYDGMRATPEACAIPFSERFSPAVLAAYNAALDNIKQLYDIESFHLTGFDGGGAIAALLAARRDDVLSLRTVAGTLDPEGYSALHGLPMPDGSLSPIDYADRLVNMPQHHYIGGQDTVMPPQILHSYLQALGPSTCVQYSFIQEAEHKKGWVDKWPELLKRPATCTGALVSAPEEPEELMIGPQPIFTLREAPKGK